MGALGLEPRTNGLKVRCSTNLTDNDKSISDQQLGRSAEATAQGDFATGLAISLQQGPDLAFLIDRWPGLPQETRTAILALIRTAMEGNAHE